MSYSNINILNKDTICALSTVAGVSAIAVVRVSGKDAFGILNKIFEAKDKDFDLKKAPSHIMKYGFIKDGAEMLDDVVINIYREPHSYTGEDSVEVFCHGSLYIQQKLLEILVEKGCRLAQAGEYTLRAFVNGKLDLSQAEAVADLIAAQSKSAHELALKQLRGGFSDKINALRKLLLQFTALIELELDFSDEDVEFADRSQLIALVKNIEKELQQLLDSFRLGNVLKRGIPVAIVGKPNVGKSTLLNVLLNEERAIVSSIPGTTRDAIEDAITIEGISFRFIDTAGLRSGENEIENMGIEKTFEKIKQAHIILYVFDLADTSMEEINEKLEELKQIDNGNEKEVILVGNKSDLLVEMPHTFKMLVEKETVFISAKRCENINLLTSRLLYTVNKAQIDASETVVSNVRHYDALQKARDIIIDITALLQQDSSHELLAADLRRCLYYLDEITGLRISSDNILGEIFGKFCIGK